MCYANKSFLWGTSFLWFALVAWIFLLYTFLSLTILKKEKPSPETGLNGSWLLIIVSTQSLVILATSLVAHLPVNPEITFFVSLTAWLVSILFYVVLVTLLFYRLTFYRVTPAEITPDYWIDTGAAAISALAGVTLINDSEGLFVVQQYIPLIKLLCLLLWGAATFWLPLLFILETWRHVKSGFKYKPAYWGLVFPLGMYAVASLKLSPVLHTTFPGVIGQNFIYIALATWIIIFIAMIYNIIKTLSVNRNPIYKDKQ